MLKISGDVNRMNLILRALGNLPYVEVAQAINEIQAELQEQVNKQNAPAEAEAVQG